MLRYLLLLLIPLSAAAQVYKWVDPQGRVHYSDTPTGRKGEQSISVAAPAGQGGNAAPAPVASPSEQGDALKQRLQDRAKAEEESREKAAQAEQQENRCKQLKGNMYSLKRGDRLYEYDENGKRRKVDKAAELQKTQKQLEDECAY